jgi:hypothetical protein
MNYIDWIGFFGVFLILLAYFFNTIGKVKSNNLIFIVLNLIGAIMACLASILLNYIPFIILESTWAIISLVALFKQILKK